MRQMRNPLRLVLTTLLLLGPSLISAQPTRTGSSSAPRPTAGHDRLFLAFIEDATVIDGQWWEGQAVLSGGDIVDANLVRGLVALQPWRDVEVGGRVGFGNTDTLGALPEGSGATDLDVWGKYYLGTRSDAEFAVGVSATIPTGDDTAGLGYDAFGLSLFGTFRYRLPGIIISGHAGARVHGDGQTLGLPEQDGEVSPIFGVGVISPFSDRVNIIGEAVWEGERFEGNEDDLRLLGGLSWRSLNRGMIRAAFVVGASDGAPDAELLVGYAARF